MVFNPSKGVLLIHGLTGTPANLEPLQNRLQTAGLTTLTPLLEGHQSVAVLNRTPWEQWFQTVLDSFEALSQKCDEVHCCGLSLGSLLALKLASSVGPRLKSVALLGLPLRLDPWYDRFLIPLFRYSPLQFFVASVPKNFEKSVADPQGVAIYRRTSLDRMPVHAVLELKKLARHLHPLLSHIIQPILAIHAQNDPIASPQSLKILERALPHHRLETLILKRSRHVVTLDYEKDLVSETVLDFFRRQGGT